MSKKTGIALSPEVLAKFKELHGYVPHRTWDEEKVLDEIAKKEKKPPEPEPPKKKELKPVHTSLFIPKFGETPARLVQRDNWTEQDTKDYREAYKDRQKKAMKKLK
jgi:hypothetical protein